MKTVAHGIMKNENELENLLIPVLQRLLEKLEYEDLSVMADFEIRLAHEALLKEKEKNESG